MPRGSAWRLAVVVSLALALAVGCASEPGETTDPGLQKAYAEGSAEQVLEEEGYVGARIARVQREDALNWTVTAADATGAPVCIDLKFRDLTYERFSYALC